MKNYLDFEIAVYRYQGVLSAKFLSWYMLQYSKSKKEAYA